MSDSTFLIKLGMNTDALVAGINKSNSLLSGFKSKLTAFGTQIASGLGFVGLGYQVVQTVQRMAEFEHSMSALKAITGATGDQLDKLRQNALEMASAFSANDIAQFELELSRMGFTTNQVIDSTEAIINLATATGENLVKSGEIAGSTMKAFGLGAKDMTRITDVMSGALNLSSLKLDSFGEGMKYVAPIAKQAGVSLEETAAMLIVLANAGIKGSMAGTSLRRIFTDFTVEGANASEKLAILSKTGITLGQSFDEVGRTAQSALAILGNSGNLVQKATEDLKNMNGVTKAQADIMQNDMVGSWHKLGAAWDRIIQKGTGVNLALKTVIDYYTLQLNLLGNIATWVGKAFDTAPLEKWQVAWNKQKFDYENPGAKPRTFYEALGGAIDVTPKEHTDPLLKAREEFARMHPRITELEADIKGLGDKIKNSFDPATIGKFTAEIDKLQDKIYHLMNDKAKWFQDATKRSNSQGSQLDESAVPGSVAVGGGNLPALSGMTAQMDVMIKTGARMKGLLDGFHLSSKQLGMAFVNMGSQMSSGLALAIQGTIPFAQAMAQMALSVVDSLERIALARIIEKATENSAFNPVGAIALAVVGFAAIKALFSSIGASSGGGGGSASSGAGSYVSQGSQTLALAPGQFKISGRDLVYAYDKNKALNPYVVGG